MTWDMAMLGVSWKIIINAAQLKKGDKVETFKSYDQVTEDAKGIESSFQLILHYLGSSIQ